MAKSQNHIVWASIFGFIAYSSLYSLFINSVFWPTVISKWLFLFIGALLPDIDSIQSIAFSIVVSLLSFIIATISFLFLTINTNLYSSLILVISLLLMLLLLVAQNILYKLFNHRGMMHSIPAIVITSLIALNLMYINGLDIDKAFSSMLFLGIGYISHLVVDFASTNNKLSMNGVNWTCLKLYTTGQNRKYRNTITYVILMLMIIITLLNSNLMKEVKIITNKRVQKNIYRTKY